MSVAKLRSYSSVDTMKPGQKVGKPEEGNDSLDSFIRQAIGKEPVLSFSRAGDSPVQWIQLLHALDQQGTNKLSKGSKLNNIVEGKEHQLEHCNGVSSFASEMNGVKESSHPIKSSGVPVKGMKSASEHMQTLKIPEAVVAFAQAAAKANGEPEKYLPGWPLLSPPKVQMQKCDKCTREFCSPINYRRHIRVHRRSLNIDKDFPKNRDFLGAFWDKLSLDEAKEIVSFKNVALEEVPGSSIIKALTSFIRKPGFSSLPQVYVKAGAALLDVIQAKPSRFPISSHELFSILDDASEKTFLCVGTAVSMQKFVFDGEAGKIGLEMKNLVACTSFLVEQKLVKAWLADKDAEALRCQKLLVEEEEAAQKRQAELLERRRQKKLRQKEQKAKEQNDGDETDYKEGSPDSLEGASSSAGTASPLAASNPCTPEDTSDTAQLLLEPTRLLNNNEEADARCYSGSDDTNSEVVSGYADLTNCEAVDLRMQQGSGRRHVILARRPASSSHRGASNGFHSGQVFPGSNLGSLQKHGIHRDQRATSVASGHKVWTRKTKAGNEGEDLNARVQQREVRDQPDLSGNCEVLIGSISVTLEDGNYQQRGAILASPRDQFSFDHKQQRQNNVQEKPFRADSGQNSANRSMVKLWRPVGRHEAGNSFTVQNSKREAEVDMGSSKADDQSLNESCLSCGPDNGSASSRVDSLTVVVEGADPGGPRLFCRRVAEAFLAQRWKEAIAADHVKLVLSPETELQGCPENQDDAQITSQIPSDINRGILCSAENRMSDAAGPLEPATIGATKSKFRAKPEKGSRLKYIPKWRN